MDGLPGLLIVIVLGWITATTVRWSTIRDLKRRVAVLERGAPIRAEATAAATARARPIVPPSVPSAGSAVGDRIRCTRRHPPRSSPS